MHKPSEAQAKHTYSIRTTFIRIRDMVMKKGVLLG